MVLVPCYLFLPIHCHTGTFFSALQLVSISLVNNGVLYAVICYFQRPFTSVCNPAASQYPCSLHVSCHSHQNVSNGHFNPTCLSPSDVGFWHPNLRDWILVSHRTHSDVDGWIRKSVLLMLKHDNLLPVVFYYMHVPSSSALNRRNFLLSLMCMAFPAASFSPRTSWRKYLLQAVGKCLGKTVKARLSEDFKSSLSSSEC